jgi:hypothetical protein
MNYIESNNHIFLAVHEASNFSRENESRKKQNETSRIIETKATTMSQGI